MTRLCFLQPLKKKIVKQNHVLKWKSYQTAVKFFGGAGSFWQPLLQTELHLWWKSWGRKGKCPPIKTLTQHTAWNMHRHSSTHVQTWIHQLEGTVQLVIYVLNVWQSACQVSLQGKEQRWIRQLQKVFKRKSCSLGKILTSCVKWALWHMSYL